MSRTEQREDRTDDLSWAMSQPERRCVLCRRPNPNGVRYLGRGTGSTGGSQVPVCRTGEGCMDGTVYHGPQGRAHQPDEACEICAAGVATGRGNQARTRSGRSNRSTRYR